MIVCTSLNTELGSGMGILPQFRQIKEERRLADGLWEEINLLCFCTRTGIDIDLKSVIATAILSPKGNLAYK
jgi:hypothetical protein